MKHFHYYRLGLLLLAIGLVNCSSPPKKGGEETTTVVNRDTAFKGKIELDIRDSKSDWGPYTPKNAPAGSPNILICFI